MLFERMLFEIYIPPYLEDLEKIQQNLNSFLKFKNFLDKFDIIIYSKFHPDTFNLKRFYKLNIRWLSIDENTNDLYTLWIKNIKEYEDLDWVVHYDVRDKLIEFDFIKMIFKKIKNTFVKSSYNTIFTNLFCIDTNLLIKYISNKNNNFDPDFILNNSFNYYFLKYMNILSTDKNCKNIYI